MDLLLKKACQLELHAKDLVAQGVDAHFCGEFEGFHVVLYGGLGLEVVVGVVKGAAQVSGDRLRVGGEFTDYVGLVDYVGVDEAEAGGYNAGRCLVELGEMVAYRVNVPEGGEGDGERIFFVEIAGCSAEGLVPPLIMGKPD